MALIDLTGKKFGRLTVLYRDETKPKGHGKKVYWICQCECGNIKSIMGDSLKSGKTISCGCYHNEQLSKIRFNDISGQQFGFLIPIKTVGQYPDGTYIWHCKCLNCGNYKDVKATYLTTGRTLSCGCISTSMGENLIKEILEELNIEYKQQFSFNDCLSAKGYKLFFDFAIFDNGELKCLIEYQGIQHYQESNFLKAESLEIRQSRDNIKRNYCKLHNIKLIEIPYTEKMKLNKEYIKEIIT